MIDNIQESKYKLKELKESRLLKKEETKSAIAQTQKMKAETKLKKLEMKDKETKKKKWEKVKKYMGKRLSKPKRILVKQKLHVDLGDASQRAPSVLGDENRFFTGHMEQEKRSMFFS